MWAVRIIHEASLHEAHDGNSFVTLTYRPKSECTHAQLEERLHVPDDWSLHKSHFQKFMKRLRKSRKGQSIKYFHCGEYGDKCEHIAPHSERTVKDCDYCHVGRPHYHAVLLGCSFNDLVSLGFKKGIEYFTSPSLAAIWKYGHVQVGEVNMQSAGYVARYCLKKITGVMADDHYFKRDGGFWVTPEYATMSKGLGKAFYDKFATDFFPDDVVPVPGQGVLHKVPRYYEELLLQSDPVLHATIKSKRQKFQADHKEEYTPERLMARYKVKKAQVSRLKKELK